MLGATDRFNYGDLLFPIIVKNSLLSRNSSLIIDNFATTKSDLEYAGALKTKALPELYGNHYDGIIIVGGEVISAYWKMTFMHLQHSKFLVFFLRVLFKLIGDANTDKLIRKWLKIPQNQVFPWIVNPDCFDGAKMAINAASGTNFTKVNLHENEFKNIMKKYDFISVRDELSKENIISKVKVNVYKSPDSAILMSKFFKITKPREKANKKVIAFQIGKNFYSGNEQSIFKQIEILARLNYTIRLVAIGKAAMHEDVVALKDIYRKAKRKNISVSLINSDIEGIMTAIATSDLFIGTSLHGNITAMAFDVPSIGIDRRVTKLSEFVKSYGYRGQKAGVDYNDIVKTVKNYQTISRLDIHENTRKLQIMADKNFDLMLKSLGGEIKA